MSATAIREREPDDILVEQPVSKRPRTDDETPVDVFSEDQDVAMFGDSLATSRATENLLPPSHALLGLGLRGQHSDESPYKIVEADVGISEYVGSDVPKIDGIIKQRFTDFLVNEVDLDGNVIHIKSLAMPQSTLEKPVETANSVTTSDDKIDVVQIGASVSVNISTNAQGTQVEADKLDDLKKQELPSTASQSNPSDPWPENFTATLAPLLSEDAISQLKQMYLEGPEPPFVSDSGWEGRRATTSGNAEGTDGGADTTSSELMDEVSNEQGRGKRGRNRGARSVRGGRGGGRGRPSGRDDPRKVISDWMSKSTRTELHQAVRQLFVGKLESETDTTVSPDEEGSRVVIKWSKSGNGGRGGAGGDRGRGRGDRPARGTFPPYIHFTLQKTNRDTQDALAHLSRILRVNPKDLSVAGTKDKRGVTTQSVTLKRGNKTVEDVWKLANGQMGRKSSEEALTRRGDRGVRIADLNYRKASLELGMLKGNAFLITLRNVQVDSPETLERAMNSIKNKGFINYYGMQRFGTASIPTHSIGLALLQSDWHKAVSLLLRHRPGEHPDVTAAREAWLIEGDLDKALELMPRRVVAERCILESYKKQGGDTRNAMGALSTIPRNLRLMYVHAYQSYVWNAIVSERIKTCGAEKPVVGDLVFDIDNEIADSVVGQDLLDDIANLETVTEEKISDDLSTIEEDVVAEKDGKRSRQPWQPPRVKTLIAEDVHKYTIFDVIMPLPGKDVAYPGGLLGERYREFLRVDGLDPDNFVRKQKEYSLSGSYRKILHLPKALSWSVLRYTDPDVALAQADEDKLLGFDPPVIDESGKFMALQIHLTLGTAAYATMALREVTKTETSSHFQTALTQSSEDQKFKGAARAV